MARPAGQKCQDGPRQRERCRQMRKVKWLIAASGGALVIGAPAAAIAATVGSTAPPGEGEGYVVQVGPSSQPIAALSHTHAKSSNGTSSSSANVVEVQGQPLFNDHHFGGKTSQTGKGSAKDHDALLDTSAILGGASPIRVQVTPWSSDSTVADNSTGGTTASSDATAEAAQGTLGSGASSVTVDVLKSTSSSSYSTSSNGDSSSTGDTTTDGAIIDAGGPNGLVIDVLHSQASTSANGTPTQNAYLVSVNGQQILSADQVQQICKNLNIQGLIGLNCVTTNGGPGHSFAQDVAAAIGGPNGLPVNLSTASASGGGTPKVAVSAALPSSPALAPAPTTVTPSGRLPFTGAPLQFLALVAAALLALGAAVTQLAARLVPGLLG